MRKTLSKIKGLFSRQEGTTTVEYAVMLAMIVLLAIAAIMTTGQSTSEFYDHNAEEIGEAL